MDKHNNFVNNGIFYGPRMYTMSVHHVLFPVPESAITSNTQGVINQNPGYAKIQDNITPLKVGDTEGDLDFVF